MNHDPLKDGISSIQLVDRMGDDLSVVNAARVSMAKSSTWETEANPTCWRCDGMGSWKDDNKDWHDCFCVQTLPMSEADTRLISYLAKHKHWTPFSHPQITLRIKMPIFIARQWFKHMVGFTRNEVSRRYVSDTPEFYIVPYNGWRKKAENVKQGSSDETVVEPSIVLSHQQDSWYSDDEFSYEDMCDAAVKYYNALLGQGVCPEQARMVLPQSMYTEFIETGSLAAYARLCSLRLDPHAQKEIQWYAQAVNDILEPLFPVSWKALTS